jgi:sodium pump decarboxylase gamma subunit
MQIETLELGVDTTFIGMGIVFLVLIVLALITWLLSSIVDGGIQRKQRREAAVSVAPLGQVTVEPVVVAPPPASLSAKTVAAIMAAVSLASGLPLHQLRFTAIRRANTTAGAWSASSTADIIANRQAYL